MLGTLELGASAGAGQTLAPANLKHRRPECGVVVVAAGGGGWVAAK